MGPTIAQPLPPLPLSSQGNPFTGQFQAEPVCQGQLAVQLATMIVVLFLLL